jgi:5-methylcytosine-specific restriction endonuclease McrA
MTTKRCPKCSETKPVESFSKNRGMKDGLQGWCKACTASNAKEYRKNNRAARTQYNKEWRAANPDKTAAHVANSKEYRQQYYQANKEMVLAKSRAYQEANKEQVTKYKNEWSRINGSGHRARARRFGVPYTSINKTAIFERDQWICGLCGEFVDRTIPWPDPLSATLDHIVPLSRGIGSPGHVESNVQLGHFCCNLLKRANDEM